MSRPPKRSAPMSGKGKLAVRGKEKDDDLAASGKERPIVYRH